MGAVKAGLWTPDSGLDCMIVEWTMDWTDSDLLRTHNVVNTYKLVYSEAFIRHCNFRFAGSCCVLLDCSRVVS